MLQGEIDTLKARFPAVDDFDGVRDFVVCRLNGQGCVAARADASVRSLVPI